MSERKKLILLMGVQRSGTTALFDVLASVPGVSARHEAASDAIYSDFYLRPEREIRQVLQDLPGAVLLKPVRESEVRSPAEVAAEYKDYDLRIIWLYRDPVNVYYSYSRLGWADSSSIGAQIFSNQWARRNLEALTDAPMIEGQILVVSYEDLVANPSLVKNLCTALGLGIPSLNTLRKDSASGRQSLPQSTQKLIHQRTREILKQLKKARSVYPPAIASSRISFLLSRLLRRFALRRHQRSVISDVHLPNHGNLQEAMLQELLNADDPALVYARWRSDGSMRRNSENSAIILGYQECESILSAMRQRSSQPLTDATALAARDDRLQRLEAVCRHRQTNLWPQIQHAVQAACATLPTSTLIDITPTLSALAEQIVGTWLGITRPQEAGLDLLLRRLPNNDAEAWDSLKQLVEATGLIPELGEGDLLVPLEVRPFIEESCLTLLSLPSVVINTLVALQDNPDVLKRLRQDSRLIVKAIHESLRLTPFVLSCQYKLVERLRIRNEVFPASATMLLMLGTANRDPLVFADPDTFRLDRDSPPPLVFQYSNLWSNRCQRLVLDAASAFIFELITKYSHCEMNCGAGMGLCQISDGMLVQVYNVPRLCLRAKEE